MGQLWNSWGCLTVLCPRSHLLFSFVNLPWNSAFSSLADCTTTPTCALLHAQTPRTLWVFGEQSQFTCGSVVDSWGRGNLLESRVGRWSNTAPDSTYRGAEQGERIQQIRVRARSKARGSDFPSVGLFTASGYQALSVVYIGFFIFITKKSSIRVVKERQHQTIFWMSRLIRPLMLHAPGWFVLSTMHLLSNVEEKQKGFFPASAPVGWICYGKSIVIETGSARIHSGYIQPDQWVASGQEWG